MDWKKAKTILIIGFLILDIFLLGQVLTIRYEKPEETLLTYAEVQDYLARRGWTLMPEEPAAPETLTTLQFVPGTVDFETAAKTLFGDTKGLNVSQTEGEMRTAVYQGNGGQLVINDFGVVFYDNEGGASSAMTIDEALSALAGPWQQELSLTRQHTEGGSRLRQYEQTYADLPLLDTYVTVTEQGGTIRNYTQQLIRVTGKGEAGPCISAGEAALSALRTLERQSAEPCAVTKIHLAYYAPQLSVQSGTAVPVWCFELQNGDTVMINALTGAAEA